MRKTYSTPGSVRLDIRLPDGDVEIATGAAGETIVELTGPDESELAEIARIDMRERGDTYEVSVEVHEREGWRGLFSRLPELRLSVQTLDGVETRVRTGSADVRGRGRFGTVAVDTGSGGIEFDAVAGDAVVKSGSGDVSMRDVSGDAVVSTASGDVEIERAVSGAQVRTASGDIRIGESGAGVTGQTASGDLQLDSVREGEITLQSASGDIHVGIRRGSRLWIDAKSMSGEASSELDVGDEPIDEEGPLVELRATSMSGDIDVVRA